MIRPRREARTAIALVLVLGGTLLAGCSKAPKPRAEVPVEVPRPAGKNGNGTVSTRRVPPPAAKPSADAGEKKTPSVSGAQAGSSTSTPAVVPQLTAAEQERLEKEMKEALELAQRGLDAVDVSKLDVEKNRKYVIARDFMTQAGAARSRKEYERAQALAIKARLLAEEIAAH